MLASPSACTRPGAPRGAPSSFGVIDRICGEPHKHQSRRWEMKLRSKRLVVLGAVIATAAAVAVPVALAVTVSGFLSARTRSSTTVCSVTVFPSGCHGKAEPRPVRGWPHVRPYDRYGLTNHCLDSEVRARASSSTCADPITRSHRRAARSCPADPSAHYLGDAGQSGSPQSFSFRVGAGQSLRRRRRRGGRWATCSSVPVPVDRIHSRPAVVYGGSHEASTAATQACRSARARLGRALAA